MATINQVMERVELVRPSAIDPLVKAKWLIDLDARLWKEVINRHERTEPLPDQVFSYPEDGDKPLLIPDGYDEAYDLYLLCKVSFYAGETDRYENMRESYQTALDNWTKAYTRTHMPVQRGPFIV